MSTEDTREGSERMHRAADVAMRLAERYDLQFAVLVGEGAVAWAARVVTGDREGHEHDPDFRAAMLALQVVRARLVAKAIEMGGERVKIAYGVDVCMCEHERTAHVAMQLPHRCLTEGCACTEFRSSVAL